MSDDLFVGEHEGEEGYRDALSSFLLPWLFVEGRFRQPRVKIGQLVNGCVLCR